MSLAGPRFSSLSGRVGVKRFQTLRRSDVGCHSQVLASLRDRHLDPPMMGSGGCGGPIYRGVLAIRLTAGSGLETDSPHPSSCGDIAPPVGGIHVSPVSIVHNSLCDT